MFGFIKKQKAAQILAPFLSSLQQQIVRNQILLRSNAYVYGFGDATQQLNAYATIDDLYSIVRKIAKTCKRIPLYVYEVKDQQALSKYKIMQRKAQHGGYTNKKLWDLKELHLKALEIIGETDPLQMVLDKPNDWQTKDEFYEAAFTFPLLSGNDYIQINIIPEGANMNKPLQENAMWHLPPDTTFPIPSLDTPRKPVGYKSMLYGTGEEFTLDKIMHRRYFNPIYDYMGNELVGMSPLHAARKTLTQIGNERDYANRSLINAGAEGALIGEDINDLSPEALGQMKDDVLRELGANWAGSGIDRGKGFSTSDRPVTGTNLNAKKLGFLAGKWNYLKLTISPADMQLVQQGQITFKKLCNVYGVSDILFNNSDAGTDNIVRHMVTELYTNVVLPEVTALRDTLQAGLAWRYKDKQRIIDYDISDISELQEDSVNVATRFATLPVFRPNDLFEALGFGKVDDPSADVLLIKQGYLPLDDVINPVDYTNPAELAALTAAKANDYGE